MNTPTPLHALHDAIARRDPQVTYERGEFDQDGTPVICTYRASDPYRPIACRDDMDAIATSKKLRTLQ